MLALGVAGVFQDSVNLSLFLLPPYLAYAAWQSSVGESLRSAASALEKKPWPEGKLLRAIPLVCPGKSGKGGAAEEPPRPSRRARGDSLQV